MAPATTTRPGWAMSIIPPPPTYGYAVYPAFDVAEGAMFGYEMGFATDYFLAPAPVWGPIYYGYWGLLGLSRRLLPLWPLLRLQRGPLLQHRL